MNLNAKDTLKTTVIILFLCLLSLLAVSCSGNSPAEEFTPTPEITATHTPTPEPTATPQPETIAIITLPGYDPQILQSIQSITEETANANGMVVQLVDNFESVPTITNLKIAILLNMPNDLDGLINSAPDTQFILYSEWDIQPTNNLNIIRIHPEYRSFMAGYLIEMIAADMRAAALLPNDTVYGTALEDSLRNGGSYYCGICQTYYAPYVQFPLATSLPAATDMTTWLNATDEMLKNYVYAMYVSPEITTPELLYELARRGLMLVGGSTPPAELGGYWAATITYDRLTPLKELLPTVLSGQSGNIIDAPLGLADTNSDLFSVGKQHLFEATYQDLEDGLIYPYNPQ